VDSDTLCFLFFSIPARTKTVLLHSAITPARPYHIKIFCLLHRCLFSIISTPKYLFFLYIYIQSIYLLLFIPIKLLIGLDKKWLQSRPLYGGRCIFDRFGHNVLYILFHCVCTICLTQRSSTTHALQRPPSPHQMFLLASRVFFFNYLNPQSLIFFVHL